MKENNLFDSNLQFLSNTKLLNSADYTQDLFCVVLVVFCTVVVTAAGWCWIMKQEKQFILNETNRVM